MTATKCNCHARSNSVPSTTHPLISEFDEQLCRLRTSGTASSSSTSVNQCLNGLKDLYDSLAQEENDELLDGSLRLLDVCSVAKDTLLQTKECTIEILSIIRRRRGGKTELASEVKKFLIIRKVMKKAVCKALGNLKGVSPFSKEHEAVAMVSMLKEMEAVTQTVFDSIFSFISGPKTQSKPSGLQLVSNLMRHKRVAACKEEEEEEEEETDANEFAMVDAALHSIVGHKTKESDNIIQNAQTQLQNLELCIQDLEESLEHFSRRLIKADFPCSTSSTTRLGYLDSTG
ncbi:PREDICTED: Protein of unknown function DUF241 [Prunus dulcis]|uniref:Uncharacterized protein n=1 Tax=Prunus dulcis TaxID=3755 RepID=A0A5E4FR90_PRUDU|nr:PREDICTED: Protein of unknown function DUF241 [Prunus dulcis]